MGAHAPRSGVGDVCGGHDTNGPSNLPSEQLSNSLELGIIELVGRLEEWLTSGPKRTVYHPRGDEY